MAITNYLDQRETAKETVLKILGDNTEEKHGDLSILSSTQMIDAICSAKGEKEKQQTSSTPVRIPGYYNTANMPTQPVGNLSKLSILPLLELFSFFFLFFLIYHPRCLIQYLPKRW
jgi:hypothetical protein